MNKWHKRLLTLNPDEHVLILRERVLELMEKAGINDNDPLSVLGNDICQELESLAKYLRKERQ